MAWSSRINGRGIALLLAALVVLGTVPGVAAAETRSGGSVVVEQGETVSELTAYGGTVTVRGTVEGDLTVFGGNVRLGPTAEVTGDIEATGGNIRIAGAVEGTVSATGGNVFVTETATIGGDLEVAAGTIDVAGTVRGDAELAGGSITLAAPATIEGDVTYAIGEDGEFTNTGATVTGTVTREEDLSMGAGPGGIDTPDVTGPVFEVLVVLINFAVGALLLLVLPGTAGRVADRVQQSPLRTAGIGLAGLIGIPIALGLVAVTIIGLPITVAGAVVYALTVWLATIYGRFALGSGLLAAAGIDNRWAGLAVGVGLVALLARLPLVGSLVEFVVLLLGLGALVELGYRFLRRQRGADPADPVEDPAPA